MPVSGNYEGIGANFGDYLNTVIIASESDGTFSTFTGKG